MRGKIVRQGPSRFFVQNDHREWISPLLGKGDRWPTSRFYSVEDKVLTLTLNRAERLNAFTGVMCRELIDAFDRADADDSVRAVIVTGAGRAFCAGADLGGGSKTFDASARGAREPIEEHRDGGGLLTLRIYDSKPVIAAINGAAVGIGITMTLPMDIRIASAGARMGSCSRDAASCRRHARLACRAVGISRAAEWVYTGRVFGAEEALAGSLVSRVVAPRIWPPRAIAHEIADHTSAMSVALTRQMLWKMLGADHPMEAHRLEGGLLDGRSTDAHEASVRFSRSAPRIHAQAERDARVLPLVGREEVSRVTLAEGDP